MPSNLTIITRNVEKQQQSLPENQFTSYELSKEVIGKVIGTEIGTYDPSSSDVQNARSGQEFWRITYPTPKPKLAQPLETTTILQIWEGRVIRVIEDGKAMEVMLSAKMGDIPDHKGEVDLRSVSPQDWDLVRPGAVFYLTLYYRRTAAGTITNSQELRFRRLPAWTKEQIREIDAVAGMLLKKIKPLPKEAK